jgi:UDP-galactopyranose mutase
MAIEKGQPILASDVIAGAKIRTFPTTKISKDQYDGFMAPYQDQKWTLDIRSTNNPDTANLKIYVANKDEDYSETPTHAIPLNSNTTEYTIIVNMDGSLNSEFKKFKAVIEDQVGYWFYWIRGTKFENYNAAKVGALIRKVSSNNSTFVRDGNKITINNYNNVEMGAED